MLKKNMHEFESFIILKSFSHANWNNKNEFTHACVVMLNCC